MTRSFSLSVPAQVGTGLTINLAVGQALFVVGANGTGKSSLLHRFFCAHITNARRLSAHRQTWFDSGSISITGVQRRATENHIRSWDAEPNARWREEGSAERTGMALYDLVDANNVRARSISEAVDADRIDLAIQLRRVPSPVNTLNEILQLSNVPISISLRGNDEVCASKHGGAHYSVAELSDGERNVLLMAAAVLTARPGSLIIIDEPERHIHRAISSGLLASLFSRREDCAFVVSTHDVTLPVDVSDASTLLVRACTHRNNAPITWDADLLSPGATIDDAILLDILGGRRRILFVEGTARSLDLPLYGLLFPEVSIVPKASCRDVEHAVSGIREAEALHWVRAFGIVDSDSRTPDDLSRLKAKGVYALDVHSVEAIYYHSEVQRRVAARHASVTGEDAGARLASAKTAALAAVSSHKVRLSERVAEKGLREQVFRHLPRREDVAARRPIHVMIDVAAEVAAETARLDAALAASDYEAVARRYPIRETQALANIAHELGFQGRTQYESAVRKLLLEDASAVDHARGLLGDLFADITR